LYRCTKEVFYFLEKCIILLYNVFIKNEFAREYDYGI